jgi:hypothetical protein
MSQRLLPDHRTDAATAMAQMRNSGDLVLIAEECQDGLTYKSFATEAELYQYLKVVGNADRHAMAVDLSSWRHTGANYELEQWASSNFVSIFSVGMEWDSTNAYADPTAMSRVLAVQDRVTYMLQRVGHCTEPIYEYCLNGGVSARTGCYTNRCFLRAMTALFTDNDCLTRFVYNLLLPSLTGDAQLHTGAERDCIVYPRGTMTELPGNCPPRSKGVPMVSLAALQVHRLSMHVSEVHNRASIITVEDVNDDGAHRIEETKVETATRQQAWKDSMQEDAATEKSRLDALSYDAFRALPANVLLLLEDLGFVEHDAVVSRHKMQQSWFAAMDTDYRSDIDAEYNTDLSREHPPNIIGMVHVRVLVFDTILRALNVVVRSRIPGRPKRSQNTIYKLQL